MCLTAGKTIPEHTSPRNAIVNVIEDADNLNLQGKDIDLVPRVLFFMPANAPHGLQAKENLAFTLTLIRVISHWSLVVDYLSRRNK